MPRNCLVCSHPERQAIEAGLVANETLRSLARRFEVSHMSLARHKRSHLAGAIVQLEQAADEVRVMRDRASALNIAEELGTILERARLLSDACDRWLRDPDNEERYDVGPRAEEVWVIYEEMDGEGKPRKRKELLHTLWRQIEERKPGVVVTGSVIKHADIRELVLKAQAGSIAAIETVAGLMERAWELQSRMDEASKIRAMSETEVRVELREMLRGVCGLSEKATDAFMSTVERGARVRAVEQMEADLEGEEEAASAA